MPIGSYIFDARTETPASVARRRAIAQELMGGMGSPSNVGEGLNALGHGIAAGVQNYRANRAEEAGQSSGRDAIAGILANPQGADVSTLMAAESNQWLPPGQKDIVDELLKQQIDPTAKLEQEKLRAEIAKLGKDSSKQYGTPVYGLDADSNVVLMQPTSAGDLARPALPDGVTSIIPPDQMAGAKSYQTNLNKAAAGAAASIPMADQLAGEINQQIDTVEAHPYLDSMVGPIAGRMPNLSAQANDFQSQLDQIGGDAFLQARQLLRGGGQITDYEGQQAQSALVRMKASLTNPTAFKKALEDFRGHVNRGMEVLKQQAALGGGLTAPSAGPVAAAPPPDAPAAEETWVRDPVTGQLRRQ